MNFNPKNIIVISLITLGLNGCMPSAEKAYENLQQSKSLGQFEAFIETYPESELLSKVKKGKE